eukprot:COSAG02_NODE_60_length_43475_cov_59.494582_10_plen_3160_part_00
MGGGSSKGTQVRQGTPGFDAVQPGASAAFKHTEKQLGELKRHQDDLDRQKDAVQAAIEASLARLQTQTQSQLMGMTFLKQTAALELDRYERTTVHGLPSEVEHDAALHIQRRVRGKAGRRRFKQELRKQVDLNFKAASMVQRFFRGKKERDRMRPLREAQRKDAAGMSVVLSELHSRLPHIADRLFKAQFRADFHRAQAAEHEALCVEFNRAAGAQMALDAFERLADGELTGRADFGHSVAATKQILKQRMYQQMASAAVLRETSSRYVACKRRLGVIEVLKPWVQRLPTPPESTEEEMARDHQKELLKVRQEYADYYEEHSLTIKQKLEVEIARIDTNLEYSLVSLGSATDAHWVNPVLANSIEQASVKNDLAYTIEKLKDAGLCKVKPLVEGSVADVTAAGIQTSHALRILEIAKELKEPYYLEVRDMEVAHMARHDADVARHRARNATNKELDKLREKNDRAYSDALDQLAWDHLQARLEREADAARPPLDLKALQRELAAEADAAVREVEALTTARAARAIANKRARKARGALKQLRVLAPTQLDQDDDVRVAAAVKDVQQAEEALVAARAAAAEAAADAPLGDANVHLAAMRAKLAMVEAFMNLPPTKTVVRTHAGYIGSEIEQVKAEMAELAPHIAEYKASRNALGETLGALDCFTAGLVGNQLKAAALRKIWSQVDADGSGDLDREEVAEVLKLMSSESAAEIGPDDVDRVMAEIDDDGGGSIEFAEFAEWYERQEMSARHEDAELIKRMFEEADVDGGGSLDRQEVGKLLLRMNPALAAEAERMENETQALAEDALKATSSVPTADHGSSAEREGTPLAEPEVDAGETEKQPPKCLSAEELKKLQDDMSAALIADASDLSMLPGVEFLDTKGTSEEENGGESEVRLVRVVVNKLEKAEQKKAEVVEMEDEVKQLQAELKKRIKESESAEAKAAAVVAEVYANNADVDPVDPSVARLEEIRRMKASIDALKQSIDETNSEVEKLLDVTAGESMEVACVYKWHEDEYNEPAKTEHDKIRNGWILSREGVVMEDVNIQVTRTQVDELMARHNIELSVGYMNSVFGRYDEDRSGALDREEFEKFATVVVRKYLQIHASSEKGPIDIAFEQMDPDGSGEVDYEEFIEWWGKIGKLDAAKRMQKLKSTMRELLAEAVCHEGAKVTAKKARRRLDLAIGEASIYSIFGARLSGEGSWTIDTHAETLKSMSLIEKLKVTSHKRRHPNDSLRSELAEQQQLAANARVRLWAAEETLELIDPISERALPGTTNELRIAADIEFNAADDAVNAAQFRCLALKRERSKMHFVRGRLCALAKLQWLMDQAKALEPDRSAELRRVWTAVDKDGSGSLDLEELREVLRMMGRDKITQRGLEAAMKEIDKDDSGDIDFDEFESWYFSQDPKDQERMLAQDVEDSPLEEWQQEKVLMEDDIHAYIKNKRGREAWTLCFAVLYGSEYQKTWAPRIFFWQNEKPGLGQERYLKWQESGGKVEKPLFKFSLSKPKGECAIDQGMEKRLMILTVAGKKTQTPSVLRLKGATNRKTKDDSAYLMESWFDALTKAVKRPPSLQANEPDPDWFIKQQALWKDGVANFAMLASTSRLRAEEEIEVANQAVQKSQDAVLALCKLHGQINANVIIDGASLVQSGEGADAHSLLASEGLIKAKKNVIKTQRVLISATSCVLENAVAVYKAEKGRLGAIRSALPILRRLAEAAPTAAGIGGIGGKRFKEELDRLMDRETEQVRKCEQNMVAADVDTEARPTTVQLDSEAQRNELGTQGAIHAVVMHEKNLRSYFRAKGYCEFVQYSGNEMLAVQALAAPIEETRRSAITMLEAATQQKARSQVAYQMFEGLQSKLLNARAKKLIVEMYAGGVLPTKEELLAHIALLMLEEAALSHTNVVMAELSSAQKSAKIAFEAFGGELTVVKQALRNKRIAEAHKTDEQAADHMATIGKTDNNDRALAAKATTGMFQATDDAGHHTWKDRKKADYPAPRIVGAAMAALLLNDTMSDAGLAAGWCIAGRLGGTHAADQLHAANGALRAMAELRTNIHQLVLAGPHIGGSVKASKRLTVSTLHDRENHAKTAITYEGSYSGTPEQKCLAWISEVTGRTLRYSGEYELHTLAEDLHSGVALCELANKLCPGIIDEISPSPLPFPQRENIGRFCSALPDLGVPPAEMFDPSDLFELTQKRQMAAEIQSIINREKARLATLEAERVAKDDAIQREVHAADLKDDAELKQRLVEVARQACDKMKTKKKREAKGKNGEPSPQDKLDAAELAYREAAEAQADAEEAARKSREAVVVAEQRRAEALAEQEKREGPVKQLKAQIMSALEEKFLDKDGDGEIDTGALEEAFRSFDSSDDGDIDYEEFRKALKKTLGVTASTKQFSQLCTILDQDGDGQINYAEFVEWVGDGSTALQEEEVRRLSAEMEAANHKVVVCIFALGRSAYNLTGYCGPCLGRPEVANAALHNAHEMFDSKWAEWHQEGGAADQVITAAMHSDSAGWTKLFKRLEEQHAAFEAAAEQPAVDARMQIREVEQQLVPQSALRGALSELRMFIADLERAQTVKPSMELAALRPAPVEFGQAEEGAAAMLASRFRSKMARGELESRKAQKAARLEQERRRAKRNEAQNLAATRIAAVFQGLMTRRMYTFLVGQERARIAMEEAEALVKKDPEGKDPKKLVLVLECYERVVAGYELALTRPHALLPVAEVKTQWWCIIEEEQREQERLAKEAADKAARAAEKAANKGKKGGKEIGKGKKDEKGGKGNGKKDKGGEPEPEPEGVVVAPVAFPGMDRACAWQLDGYGSKAPVCDPTSSNPALRKPGPWPKGPKPITFAEPRPEQELDTLRWQLAEATHRLRLVQKWYKGHPQIKLVVKLVDGLRKRIATIENEPWHLVCMRITPDYDDVAEFEGDVVHDIEHALNTNINLASGSERIVPEDEIPEFVWLEKAQVGDEALRIPMVDIKVGKRYFADDGQRIMKHSEADPPRVTSPLPPKRLTAKRESKGETAVRPLVALDSRPITADADGDGTGALDDAGGWGQQMKPTPPSSRPTSSVGSRPSVASLHDAEIVPEDGWQFEFEIRESALLKLQQQLQEEMPAAPPGCQMVRNACVCRAWYRFEWFMYHAVFRRCVSRELVSMPGGRALFGSVPHHRLWKR